MYHRRLWSSCRVIYLLGPESYQRVVIYLSFQVQEEAMSQRQVVESAQQNGVPEIRNAQPSRHSNRVIVLPINIYLL